MSYFKITDFPLEILIKITGYLSAKDILSCCHLNSTSYNIFNNELIWRNKGVDDDDGIGNDFLEENKFLDEKA